MDRGRPENPPRDKEAIMKLILLVTASGAACPPDAAEKAPRQ